MAELVPSEREVEALARRIVSAATPTRGQRLRGLFDLDDRMLAWATKRPAFKTGLFRFVDVLPALRSARQVLAHLDEYVAIADAPVAIRAGVRTAHAVPFGATIAATIARRAT